jgi:hypothetical protein
LEAALAVTLETGRKVAIRGIGESVRMILARNDFLSGRKEVGTTQRLISGDSKV